MSELRIEDEYVASHQSPELPGMYVQIIEPQPLGERFNRIVREAATTVVSHAAALVEVTLHPNHLPRPFQTIREIELPSIRGPRTKFIDKVSAGVGNIKY